jgi:hypothetical protein
MAFSSISTSLLDARVRTGWTTKISRAQYKAQWILNGWVSGASLTFTRRQLTKCGKCTTSGGRSHRLARTRHRPKALSKFRGHNEFVSSASMVSAPKLNSPAVGGIHDQWHTTTRARLDAAFRHRNAFITMPP